MLQIKKQKRIHILSGLYAALFLSGCYTKSEVGRISHQERTLGFDEGVAHRIRKEEHERQLRLAEKGTSERYYQVPVPAYTNAEGVRIEAHELSIKILTED